MFENILLIQTYLLRFQYKGGAKKASYGEQNTLVLGSVGPGHQPYVLVVHLKLAEEASTHGTPPTASIT